MISPLAAGISWPESQRFLTPSQLGALTRRCTTGFARLCRNMRIDDDLTPYLERLYLPLGAWLARRRTAQAEGLVVGVCGSQGSGKSTMSRLLEFTLREGLELPTARLSIDDIYLTREDRETLASRVHPLFRTRGVPGTHDIELGLRTLRRLRSQPAGGSTSIPSFDKATDTRRARAEWPRHEGRAEVILFEGWCVGACDQEPGSLLEPVNDLERREDPERTWRTRVNDALAGEYRALFDLLDVLILLEVDSMDRVFEWRRLQERKLAEQLRDEGIDPAGLSVMSGPQIDRFVMHYERLTRHILKEMPSRADIVLSIDDRHQISGVRINRPI